MSGDAEGAASPRGLLVSQARRLFDASTRLSGSLERRGWVESDQPLWREFERRVAEALSEVPDHGTVVDLGGGRTCAFESAIPRHRGVRLVAVDVSAEELALNASADETHVADVAQGLPFGDGEIDLLVSRVVLEHVDGVPAAIGHMHRVLKPEARTIHFVPGRYATFAVAARILPFKPLLGLLHLAIPGSAGVVEFDVHYDSTDPVALERAFRSAGFRDVSTTWTAAQADYFKAVFPAFVVIAVYQSLVRRFGLRRLAAYSLIDARR